MTDTQSKNIKHDTDIHLLLERGRRFSVIQGENEWEAVYWGADESGDIVVYFDGTHWRFIHFDVRSMADKVDIGDLMSTTEIHQLEKDVIQTMHVSPDEQPG